uniref:Uncharacterized protein n=1 Tax=Anguilla anguilla TaxID=7936 RepID=A0A0E9WII4_ANGAN
MSPLCWLHLCWPRLPKSQSVMYHLLSRKTQC